LVEDNQEDEKIEGPNALESPPVGRVNDPDLRRLFRSVTVDEETGDAIEAEWRKAGRVGAARLDGGTGAFCLGVSSVNGSVEDGVLPRVLDVAAKR
jgi:hypothetical protein